MDPLNISGLDGGKESEQVKGRLDVTVVTTYKTPFLVNGKHVEVYLDLGEVVVCITIFNGIYCKQLRLQ